MTADSTTYQPLVSIVIPCFNCERWIGAAIESALGQSYPRTEVIVVNDGSTDGGPEVIAGFGERVRAISKPNGGASSAMNAGMRAAQGEWIQFLGSDDLLHPDKLRLLVAVSRRHPETDFVWAPNLPVREDFSLRNIPPGEAAEPEAELSRNSLEAAYAPSAAMLRTSFLRRVGEFNESLKRWVDLEYHARIAAQLPVYARLSEPLYFYRQHSGARISRANRNHSNIDQALRSLTLTTEVLENSRVPPELWKSYVWSFYVQLARSSALKGDKKTFQELLRKGARLRGSFKFHLKCSVAATAADVIGMDLTAAMMERILNRGSADSGVDNSGAG